MYLPPVAKVNLLPHLPIIHTVMRDNCPWSNPSSGSQLVGEQSNVLRVLLRNDAGQVPV
ncbi:hypothetical protein DPMN_018680 [Dreissena polymorpha]|uniref:Uncharacterized protein n=1 Tax=Dreissena polymorpha TaxID=45954 RepID=A0A9D4NJR6_DREPO|nr:hypothetical protein DPMN_018680 [Dreissena polymorpha]